MEVESSVLDHCSFNFDQNLRVGVKESKLVVSTLQDVYIDDEEVSSVEIHADGKPRVCWLHPAFGNVVALSTGQAIQLFEGELKKQEYEQEQEWKKVGDVCEISPHRDGIEDICFAPHTFGIAAAVIVNNNRQGDSFASQYLKVVRCDHPLTFSKWSEVSRVNYTVGEEYENAKAVCIAFNPSRFDDPSFVVAGSVKKTGENGEHHYLSLSMYVQSAVGGDFVRLFYHVFDVELEEEREISSVAWAPSSGGEGHTFAIATKTTVHICKHKQFSEEEEEGEVTMEGEYPKEDSDKVVFLEHDIAAVEWNTIGTALIVTGKDGAVVVLRKIDGNEWAPIRYGRKK